MNRNVYQMQSLIILLFKIVYYETIFLLKYKLRELEWKIRCPIVLTSVYLIWKTARASVEVLSGGWMPQMFALGWVKRFLAIF